MSCKQPDTASIKANVAPEQLEKQLSASKLAVVLICQSHVYSSLPRPPKWIKSQLLQVEKLLLRVLMFCMHVLFLAVNLLTLKE